MKRLSDDDKAIISARFQCVCSVGYPVSDAKATELAKYVAREAEDRILEWVEKLPIGEFRIVNKSFVDGEPNCVLITMVDWQELKRLKEEE